MPRHNKLSQQVINKAIELLETGEEKFSCHALNRAVTMVTKKGGASRAQYRYAYRSFDWNDGITPVYWNTDERNLGLRKAGLRKFAKYMNKASPYTKGKTNFYAYGGW